MQGRAWDDDTGNPRGAETDGRRRPNIRPGRHDRRGARDPGRAFAEGLRRAAQEALGLTVTPDTPATGYATPAELMERIPDHPFLALLEGPGGGVGLLCLDPGALSAVIEMQTTGRVLGSAPAARRPTRTDAAMAADLIDRTLAAFEVPLTGTGAAGWAAGWRFQMYLPDPSPLLVALEDGAHRVIDLSAAFADGGKRGRAMLALPATGRGATPPTVTVAPPVQRTATPEGPPPAAEAAASLDAVLGRLRLPLGLVAGLAPGDRLMLPASALAGVRLLAPGGVDVATARMGQAGGFRALRLLASGDPSAGSPPLAEGILLPAAAPPAPAPARAVPP